MDRTQITLIRPLVLTSEKNIYKADTILNLFADQNGEINTSEIAREYANMIDEQGFAFDLRKLDIKIIKE